MAYYFLFPEKDATLYSHPDRIKMNTGGDEILEIVKEKGSSDPRYYPSRVLAKFKSSEIQSTITDIVGNSDFQSNAKCFLQLSSTEHKNLTTTLNLEAFAVSQSWDEGTGRYSNLPTSSNGCSWVYRDNDTTATQWSTSSFSQQSTGSISALGITKGGGSWYTGSGFQGSQQFLKGDNLDVNLEVTTIVKYWSSSLFASNTYTDSDDPATDALGIENEGIIIKQPDSVEEDTSGSFGEMKYFSVDTHTIYPPRLAFKWDDSIHSSQSLAKTEGELNISFYRNKEEYNQNDETTFRIHVRDKYPVRQFTSSSNYLNPGYLTTSSFYSISHTF